jgi:Rps23 Pro-64 3,4-dihydroxylase Tpa1-like proline 4-hydroxylase
MSLESILNALNNSTEKTQTSSEKFYVEGSLDFSDLNVTIAGVGSLQFPLQIQHIESLLKESVASKFGLREQTLLDKGVRDTSEISAEKVSVQINQQKFNQMLADMRKQLGLSEDTILTPHLHNLLIYGPGQFFKPHQDSEKLDGMVATLVIILPSPHIGGDLIVQHKQHTTQLESESLMPQNLKCAAFYADCQHEVKPVKQGYRVALTYNLVLKSKSANNPMTSTKHHNPTLIQALKDYFTREVDDSDPISLVYLLDHSYSEHSLLWPLLKGNDQINALALQGAAHELNLVPHLALAEIHQSWQTDGDEEDPERYELIDEDMSFSNWFDEKGKALPYGNFCISEDEICSDQKLEDCEPDEMEAEGWMGNYGNTADYWYRRAAVILWRKEDQVVFNFKLNGEQALTQLIQLTERIGHEEQLRTILKRVHPLLGKQRREFKNEFLNLLTKLACYINDRDLASILLSKFPLKDLDSDLMHNVVQWQKIYGVDWCLEQLKQWIEQDCATEYGHKKEPSLLPNMDEIILNLINQNADIRINDLLIQHQIEAITTNNKRTYSEPPSQEAKTIRARVTIFNQLLKSCLLQQDDRCHHQLIDYALDNSKLYPESALVETVLMLKNTISKAHTTQSGFTKLKEKILHSLNEELMQGLRLPDDWSITVGLSCNCNHCNIAKGFLNSPTEIERVWPLAADGRGHITNIFNQRELPVDLSVIEGSRPYKLVMKKNMRLFTDAQKRFKQVNLWQESILIE